MHSWTFVFAGHAQSRPESNRCAKNYYVLMAPAPSRERGTTQLASVANHSAATVTTEYNLNSSG